MSLTAQRIPSVTRVQGQLHVDLISDTVSRHGANTSGFRQSLINRIRSLDPSYAPGGDDEIKIPNRIPDAYLIADDGVIVWEIESTCPLSPERLQDWADLWWELDASDLYARLPFDLRVVDKYGVERSANLCDAWYYVIGRRSESQPLAGYSIKWTTIGPGFSSRHSNLL